jgi:hypothetical protein
VKKVEILETERVQDVQALVVHAASFQGSEPFAGAFQVWDLDDLIRHDPDTGKRTVTVLCAAGDAPYHEDSMIEIELISLEVGAIGFIGDVVRRIGIQLMEKP